MQQPSFHALARALATPVAVALAVAACSSGGTPKAASSSSSTASSQASAAATSGSSSGGVTAVAFDPCAAASALDIAALVGFPITSTTDSGTQSQGALSQHTCLLIADQGGAIQINALSGGTSDDYRQSATTGTVVGVLPAGNGLPDGSLVTQGQGHDKYVWVLDSKPFYVSVQTPLGADGTASAYDVTLEVKVAKALLDKR